jgi:hypothetical protein
VQLLIFNEILHGNLRPWISSSFNLLAFKQVVIQVKSKQPATLNEHVACLKLLLSQDEELVKKLTEQNHAQSNELQETLATIQPLVPFDVTTQYYTLLISSETLRIYNQFLIHTEGLETDVDIQFQTGRLLKSLKVMAVQTNEELKEQNSQQVIFILSSLRNALLVLFFSIQEHYKTILPQTITFEDFVLLELEVDISTIPPLKIMSGDPVVVQKVKPRKFSFQFKGNNAKLHNVITLLCLQYDLLADNSTQSVESLYSTLISKDIQPGSAKFVLGCETTQFAFIIEQLKLYFNNLSPTTVEASAVFYSKLDRPITRQNLYSSKVEAPKESEEISNIIHQLK